MPAAIRHGSMNGDSREATAGSWVGRAGAAGTDRWRNVGKKGLPRIVSPTRERGTYPRWRVGLTRRASALMADNDRRGGRRGRAAGVGIHGPGRIRGTTAAPPTAHERQDGRGDEEGQRDTRAEHGSTSGEGRHGRGGKVVPSVTPGRTGIALATRSRTAVPSIGWTHWLTVLAPPHQP
jgi:hypothetical protein